MTNFKFILPLTLFFTISLGFVSCGDDDISMSLASSEVSYAFHNGQTVPTAAYAGAHNPDFTAKMKMEEMEGDQTRITVTLENTIDGQTYNMHAHDAADAANTPNGTPYNETPNSSIFAQALEGNGSSVSVSQVADISYSELTSSYNGFFVVHDPLQAISTTDISTYLVVGGFARQQAEVTYRSTAFNYDFNTGQLVPDFAYQGDHSDDLGAMIRVDELAGDQSRITVSLSNTMDGMTYNTHAHDMADPTTTPNGTPYIESPNSAVFAGQIVGNGDTASSANVSVMSYEMITQNYDGFVVVHDPLQAITTVDPTTYVILGVFAR